MLRVHQEQDRVILGLGRGRNRSHAGTVDVLLGVLAAQHLAEALRLAANGAERAWEAGDRALFLGQEWQLRVLSFDRMVAVRFWPPPGLLPGEVDRVPLPFAVARQLADMVEFSRQQASFGLRFCTPRGLKV